MPKDLSNLTDGQSTYGIFEYMLSLDALFYDLWLMCAEPSGLGLGLGFGIMLSTMITKSVFIPGIIYGQMMGIKMQLLKPDLEESQTAMKRYQSQGVSRFTTKIL
jgi:membrane protein insertase Oxa1/YidC/SpoIIIJ